MNQGYYKLTADVKNPKPDRRSKRRTDAAEVWKAGMVVFITNRAEAIFRQAEKAAGERLPDDAMPAAQGEVRFPDGTQVMYNLGETDSRYPEYTQGNVMLDRVVPAEKTLGQVLKQADWRAEDLLALLIDAGKITLADVDEIKQKDLTPEVDGNNWQVRDAATDAFQKRHGIS